MPQPLFADVLQYLRRTCGAQAARDLADGELLKRFLADRQDPAFTVLVHRHGRMVLAVCQRLLGDVHAAEDAFQATFMVLVRRAASLRGDKPLGSWLHAVARRIALRARAQAALRRDKERRVSNMPRSESLDDVTWQELRSILDDEIARLPEKFRAPIVMCYLEGRSYQQAAQELGCPKSSLASRLERGRELLRQQLTRRGIALPAAALTTALCEKALGAPVGAILTINTAKAAVSIAAGKAVAGGCLSATAISLAEEAISAMTATKAMLVFMVVAVGLTVGGVGLAGYRGWGDEAPPAKVEQVPPVLDGKQAAVEKKGPDVAVDLYGDPLPAGAMARLGTVRFRPGGTGSGVAFSPDGNTLVSLGDNGLKVWDAATGRPQHWLRSNREPFGAPAFSPDGKILAHLGDVDIQLIDVATGKNLGKLAQPQSITYVCVAISPDGKKVAAGELRATKAGIAVWDLATQKLIYVLPGDDEPIYSIAFSPDSKTLATGGDDKTIRLWDVTNKKQFLRLEGHDHLVTSIAFGPSGKLVASAGPDAVIRLWDVDTGNMVKALVGRNGTNAVVFSPDGRQMAAAGFDSMIHVWDVVAGMELRQWRASGASIVSLAFSPDGKVIASLGGREHAIRRWDSTTGEEIAPIASHFGSVELLRFAPDGKTLFSFGIDRKVLEWDLANKRARDRLFKTQLGPVNSREVLRAADLSQDGGVLATAGSGYSAFATLERSTIRIWDTISGKELRAFGVKEDVGQDVKFSPDCKLLASAGKNGLCLWEVATGKELWRLTENLLVNYGPEVFFNRLAFSPDSRLLAYPSSDLTIRLVDVGTGKERRRWKQPDPRITNLIYSRDGKMVASCDNKTVRIWAVSTGKEIARFGGKDPIWALAFSPNDRILAAGGTDWSLQNSLNGLTGVVQLIEVLTGHEIRRIDAPQALVGSLTFSPDSHTLASGGGDSTILLWDLTGHAGKPKPAPPTAAQLDDLWLDLIADATKADRAIWSLAFSPQQSVPFLKERLRPMTPAPAEQVAKLIAELDDQRFAVRQKAAQALLDLHDTAESAIRKSLAANPPLEVRQRLEQILEKGDKEVIRKLRAIEALEQAGTPEARQVLQVLAENTPNPRVAEAARSALERLRLKS